MGHYSHLTPIERETIMLLRREGMGISQIAREIHRARSTVLREIARNGRGKQYSAHKAQERYEERRENCRRKCLLDDPELLEIVRGMIVLHRWSPEQISGRLKFENCVHSVGTSTIYRAIHGRKLDYPQMKKSKVGFAKFLRHKGKHRKKSNVDERRGKFQIPHLIDERPAEAQDRSETGHFEADTVVGRPSGACAVTIADRKSRLAIIRKAPCKKADEVGAVLESMLEGHEVRTITPDRGKEFAGHRKVTEDIGAEFYFPLPHQPWMRGTNENMNGLIREYIPKGANMDDIPEVIFLWVEYELNNRPRKCLGYRTPYEVYYSVLLHLI